MSSALFNTKTHYVDSSHVRQYPHTLANEQEDVLKIAIKQYTPLSNLSPQPGDVSIIAAHANGVGKELYEPLWDELLRLSVQADSFRIRNVWMADVAWQGESGVLNEQKLGNDPSWYDHSRDLLHFINVYRKDLPLPIIGVGHSMGGNQIVNLSLMHPRLLSGVILLDPVLQKIASREANYLPALLSTFRRDKWPSRKEAETSMRGNRFYATWDPRCFDLWIKYGLRELPIAAYPENTSQKLSPGSDQNQEKSSHLGRPDVAVTTKSRPVTLTTTKFQEVFTFIRGNYPAPGSSLDLHEPDKRTHPDMTAMTVEKPFYRPEPHFTFNLIPHLRPPCLDIVATGKSQFRKEAVQGRLEIMGTGIGGSGGVSKGAVKMIDIPDAGHFVPFEKPNEVAKHIFAWLSERLRLWREDLELERRDWETLDAQRKRTFDEDRRYWTKWERQAYEKDTLKAKADTSKL